MTLRILMLSDNLIDGVFTMKDAFRPKPMTECASVKLSHIITRVLTTAHHTRVTHTSTQLITHQSHVIHHHHYHLTTEPQMSHRSCLLDSLKLYKCSVYNTINGQFNMQQQTQCTNNYSKQLKYTHFGRKLKKLSAQRRKRRRVESCNDSSCTSSQCNYENSQSLNQKLHRQR